MPSLVQAPFTHKYRLCVCVCVKLTIRLINFAMRRLRKASEHREQTSVYICIYSRHLQNVDRSVGEEEKRKGQNKTEK